VRARERRHHFVRLRALTTCPPLPAPAFAQYEFFEPWGVRWESHAGLASFKSDARVIKLSGWATFHRTTVWVLYGSSGLWVELCPMLRGLAHGRAMPGRAIALELGENGDARHWFVQDISTRGDRPVRSMFCLDERITHDIPVLPTMGLAVNSSAEVTPAEEKDLDKATREAFSTHGDVSYRALQVSKYTSLQMINEHDEPCTFYIYPMGMMLDTKANVMQVGADVNATISPSIGVRLSAGAQFVETWQKHSPSIDRAYTCHIPAKGSKKPIRVPKIWLEKISEYCIAWKLDSAKEDDTHPGCELHRPLELERKRVNQITLRKFSMPHAE
jgi:hypothetical protein